MRITFEGEHRCGKGTQIDLCKEALPDALVVRGDGSYQGGLEGILDESHTRFRESLNRKLYTPSDEHDALWDVAATACASVIVAPELKGRDLLIDRGPISRASFLLSQGVPSHELAVRMYPAFAYDTGDGIVSRDAIALEEVDFGTIIYLRVPTAQLLERIASDDPKAEFRRSNIREKEGLFDKAVELMPRIVQDAIVEVSGVAPPAEVHAAYAHLLSE